MIRVLIADDSQVFQRLISSCLEQDPDIEIVGIVDNGIDAVEQCRQLKPDLVTMDVFMPRMTGLEATRQIMKECPTRIVIISSMINATHMALSFEAMQAGAIDVIDKSRSTIEVANRLSELLAQSMMARPERRLTWSPQSPSTPPPSVPTWTIPAEPPEDTGLPGKRPSVPHTPKMLLESLAFDQAAAAMDYRPKLICIGGSTGAPAVVADLLRGLPATFHVPIVVAQHIVKGFVRGMAGWLNASVRLEVAVAEDDERLLPGRVLFAPADMHIGVTKKERVVLTPKTPGDLYVPSVNHLFHSVARAYRSRALGIILSGMGSDGADGLARMRENGAFTIAQSESSAVVYGMPKVATASGAAMKEMNPNNMITLLKEIDTHF